MLHSCCSESHPVARQFKIHVQKDTFAKACAKGGHASKARSRDRLAHTAWPVSSWTSIETDWFNALRLANCPSSQRGFGRIRGSIVKMSLRISLLSKLLTPRYSKTGLLEKLCLQQNSFTKWGTRREGGKCYLRS